MRPLHTHIHHHHLSPAHHEHKLLKSPRSDVQPLTPECPGGLTYLAYKKEMTITILPKNAQAFPC